MTDGELYTALRGALLTGLAARGFSAIDVLQAQQPQTFGAVDGPALYMSMVNQTAYGSSGISEEWDGISVLTQTQSQRYETTLQVMAWSLTEIDSSTANDLIRAARDSVNSPQAVDLFRAAGAYITRVRDIRLSPSVDDRGQWRQNPSFDIGLSHLVTTVLSIPSATTIETQVLRV